MTQVAILNNGKEHYMASLRNRSHESKRSYEKHESSGNIGNYLSTSNRMIASNSLISGSSPNEGERPQVLISPKSRSGFNDSKTLLNQTSGS